MSDFRHLSDTMLASPQIDLGDIAKAKERGVTAIVNNRPDGEEEGQVTGEEIEKAAHRAGLDYFAIPVGHSGFSETQVAAMVTALEQANGNVLAYCRSGTRSTLLWALAQARMGFDPEEIAGAAAAAGYDTAPVRPAMDMFAARARGGG